MTTPTVPQSDADAPAPKRRGRPPKSGLAPKSRELLTVLANMTPRELSRVTNEELAAAIEVSVEYPRTVVTGLKELRDYGLIRIERRNPHAKFDRTGRTIVVLAKDPDLGVQALSTPPSNLQEVLTRLQHDDVLKLTAGEVRALAVTLLAPFVKESK